MTDDLRTSDITARIERIIENHTLIYGADECTCGCLWEVQDGFHSSDGSTCYDNHLAAAIVRELGLKRASRPSDYGHVNYPPGYQYITDWITDD